jgi:DNA repair protein RadA/Sms
MAKKKIVYVCSDCGNDFTKWQGQCTCKAWNTIKEMTISSSPKSSNGAKAGWINSGNNKILRSDEIKVIGDVARLDSGLTELNRVMGNGIAVGSINIITGEPGAGKSTLLIQAMTNLSLLENQKALYVSGEESLQQVKGRSNRLKLDDSKLLYLSETNVDNIIEESLKSNITLIVIDSVQTLFTEDCKSAAGSTSQVRDSTAKLVHYAKQNNVTILLVGHVTKDGTMAGPKVLEHMVDGSFHIEGDSGSRYRMLRGIKNRFGEANETGVFVMTEEGMKEVKNPSAIFINPDAEDVYGSAIFVSLEGNRPLLFEGQSLVTESYSENAKRLSIGVNFQRFSMLLAIMQKYSNLKFYDKDVYFNVVGGITIPTTETSSDLGVCFSMISSIEEFIIPKTIASFGEISLAGEIRPVPNGLERIKEAKKHEFKHIFVPSANINKNIKLPSGINVIPVKNINQAINELRKIID